MSDGDKPLVWLRGEIQTPPFSEEVRREAGFLLRLLQRGERLAMPKSRPMSSVGKRCHELRIQDENQSWRILYRIDEDAILILNVFSKKSGQTPKSVIEACKDVLKRYDAL
jgi:phage-related protein